MSLHKISKEVFEYPENDIYLIEDLLHMITEARREFNNVGVEFTYETFKQWFQRVHGPFPAPQPIGTPYSRRDYEKLWKIINGDNLDIIEDAAIEKGIIPKESDENPK